MKTFPIGFQRHQLYPHNGRRTEGERKGNGRGIETRHGHLFRARLELVSGSSQHTRHFISEITLHVDVMAYMFLSMSPHTHAYGDLSVSMRACVCPTDAFACM